MISKGTKVKILAGKDKRKEGEIIEIDRKNNRAKVILTGISLLPFGITNRNSSFNVLSGVKTISFEENASAFFIIKYL